ncbi:MAG: cysteine-rich CWC family protein [Vicinamibacteria bacterium]|nr:cysteine-rich CWC family protein [Vicinamibacteria bacterium]
MTAVDSSTCPLCLRANDCAMARSASPCWCEPLSIPAEVLARVPEAYRGAVCICRRCAEGAEAPKGGTPAR